MHVTLRNQNVNPVIERVVLYMKAKILRFHISQLSRTRILRN